MSVHVHFAVNIYQVVTALVVRKIVTINCLIIDEYN